MKLKTFKSGLLAAILTVSIACSGTDGDNDTNEVDSATNNAAVESNSTAGKSNNDETSEKDVQGKTNNNTTKKSSTPKPRRIDLNRV